MRRRFEKVRGSVCGRNGAPFMSCCSGCERRGRREGGRHKQRVSRPARRCHDNRQTRPTTKIWNHFTSWPFLCTKHSIQLVRVIVWLTRGFSCAHLTRPPYLFDMYVERSKLIIKSYEVAVFVENTPRSLWLVVNQKGNGLSESGIRLRNVEAFSSSQKTHNSSSYKYQSVNAVGFESFATHECAVWVRYRDY
jgi:hypothetical protein